VSEDYKYQDELPEEEQLVPTIGAALAKFAAGKLMSRKWKGHVEELEARGTRDEMVVEEQEPEDEQRIIGEDDAFWHDE
jgi:hypothetical protein